jgi:phosphoenolpyruvate synthase/pyruvate phosphate dikinase
MTNKRYIYAFEEGDGKNKIQLGGKGANLCEMTQIGLNVPAGFVINTDACLAYLEHDRLPDGLMDGVLVAMAEVEKKSGKLFGDAANPLLVSVRSGSAMSMPGMMDTILNLGLNKTTLQGLIAQTGNERFAYDAHRRFIQLFGKIALGIADEPFDAAMAAIKRRVGAAQDALPGRSIRTARNRHRGGVPFVEWQARHRLPQAVPHYPGNGQRHGGEHRHHGFRQHGQRLRHRRRLHAQSGHRREPYLR